MFRLLPRQRRLFESVLAKLGDQEAAWVDAVHISAAAAAIEAAGHRNFGEPGRRVSEISGTGISGDVQRGLIARWMLDLPVRVAREQLPQTVLDLYPFWIDQLANWLSTQHGAYDSDYWAKDVRFALALSVPGNRTQTIDLISHCSPGQIVRDAVLRANLSTLARYVMCGGWHRKWLQTHTESRHLDDFHEAGWNRLWVTAADICNSRQHLAGMLGSSWFFDPPLETISPRLAYLRRNPVAGGAFLADQGSGPTHTERAAAKSSTRRALIVSGEYVPHSWLLAWPRKALLVWAEQNRDIIGLQSGDVVAKAA
ncbi:hypothetical protein [Brevundimonas variabilis]|uniref:Uncharacterized protein n=1 Tax=Brevundimonas variabilis TaxID=74312 RepID=A0A7W9CIM4_9CAUL|nr:hypothetical protein [Brevundimonas variabilis]MBB5746364.1 hypothetical protein [Brevundimonas variabilis]